MFSMANFSLDAGLMGVDIHGKVRLMNHTQYGMVYFICLLKSLRASAPVSECRRHGYRKHWTNLVQHYEGVWCQHHLL
jgi:hypothetical protein